ncbi:MAG: HNH endonuclease [Mogibacterium sp.]|nr:HNH endonuclease [Mogibacterium sp.]
MSEAVKWREHPEYVAFMMEIIPGHTELEIRDEFYKQFKIKLSESQIKNFKHRYKIKSGTHGGHFPKGHIPFNKGKKMTEEQYKKSAATMFKPGNIPTNHRELFSERVDVDGYVLIKIAEPNKWQHKHRYIYERHYGVKLKKSDVVIFLDGNRQNFEISNLVRMTRAELARYNQDHFYGDDLDINKCAVGIAKLKTKVGELRNGTD